MSIVFMYLCLGGEMVDTGDSKSPGLNREGSSPFSGTKFFEIFKNSRERFETVPYCFFIPPSPSPQSHQDFFLIFW